MSVKEILSKLTDEEKAALVAGHNFMYTRALPKAGVGAVRMSDGPHGLRVQGEAGDNGVTASAPATAFPTAAATASGWREENLFKMGAAMAREAHKYGVHIILGPGVNIKRNPLCGRNFEYFSEDPCLAGKLAAAEVKGIQSGGVGACVKHFALNNEENYRFNADSVADMRAMREIYLKVFERVIKESKPAAVMCAYNKINGTYCAQNKRLLTDVLRKEWGFDGVVMTDWGAMHDRNEALRAGLDLEMPGDTAVCRKWISEGLKDGTLDRADLDKAAENVLNMWERWCKKLPDDCDFEENDRLAREIAEDCAVLLKNDGILPLDEGEEIFVTGDLFEKMRYQGAGSSMINPTRLTTPKKAFDDMGIKYTFERGYRENKIDTEEDVLEAAIAASGKYEKVLVFAGLTDYAESEGADRESMRLPANQLALINALVKAGKKVVVVLFGGSPIEMDFEESVSAVLNMYLPGQSGGKACANLIFGRANPSGRLAESMPMKYEDVPFGDEFGKGRIDVYKESIFVGYRYYTTAKKKVRHPFGYGLSYTSFDISNMKVADKGGELEVTCTVKNTGARAGAEVVQLYVSAPKEGIYKEERALKAFAKVDLESGAEREVKLTAEKDDLRYYDTEKGWTLQGGEYALQICRDCETVLLEQVITLEGEQPKRADNEVQQAYEGAKLDVTNEIFERMSGIKIPAPAPHTPITMESRFSDLKEGKLLGRIIFKAVLYVADSQRRKALKMPEGAERENTLKGALFLKRILESNSLITMSMSAGKSCPYNFAQGFMHFANGHTLKGIKCFIGKIKY